jgi:aspartate-alanine antiporter
MMFLHSVFQQSPQAALFLALGLGYIVGNIKIGQFQLGGIAGTLLAALLVSQVGVTIGSDLKAVMFSLFIYTVGYISGPQFFNSLNKSALKEVGMALFLSATALATVLILARVFHLDKGTAAGLAAGGLTQSSIVGTADDSIGRLALPAAQLATLQTNVAVGFAATYIFGVLGPIFVCVFIMPKLMGVTLRGEAVRAEAKLGAGDVLEGGQRSAFSPMTGRTFRVEGAAGKTIAMIEGQVKGGAAIESVQRAGKAMALAPGLSLLSGDEVEIIGNRAAVVAAGVATGPETDALKDTALVVESRDVVFTKKGANGLTLGKLRELLGQLARHGVYTSGITRMEHAVPVLPDTVLHHGDVIRLYGTPKEVSSVAKQIGYEIVPDNITDMVYLGFGILAGILIGLIVVPMGVPMSLGAGGGVLVSGLIFGWARAKHPTFGALPSASAQIMRDIGLSGFIAVVGLQAGKAALQTIAHTGPMLLGLGVIICLLPLVLTYLFGRYVLRYDNGLVFASALAGSRSADPTFGMLLQKSQSNVPTLPYAITYSIAQVTLTLLGPLIVALVV